MPIFHGPCNLALVVKVAQTKLEIKGNILVKVWTPPCCPPKIMFLGQNEMKTSQRIRQIRKAKFWFENRRFLPTFKLDLPCPLPSLASFTRFGEHGQNCRATWSCAWGEHPMEVHAAVCQVGAVNFIIRCVRFSSFVRGRSAGVASFSNLYGCLFGGWISPRKF